MKTRLQAILVALAVVAGVMLWPATANAATYSGRVSGTGGQGLFVRPGPSRASGGPMYTLGEGAGVNFDCYVHGETIAGYWYTGNIWHHLTSGGWVTDTYIYTGYNGPVPGEPVCGSSTPPPAPTPVPNRCPVFNTWQDWIGGARVHASISFRSSDLCAGRHVKQAYIRFTRDCGPPLDTGRIYTTAGSSTSDTRVRSQNRWVFDSPRWGCTTKTFYNWSYF